MQSKKPHRNTEDCIDYFKVCNKWCHKKAWDNGFAEGRKGRDRLLEALKEAHHAISILPQKVRFHYEIRCLTLIEGVLRIEKREVAKDGK